MQPKTEETVILLGLMVKPGVVVEVSDETDDSYVLFKSPAGTVRIRPASTSSVDDGAYLAFRVE